MLGYRAITGGSRARPVGAEARKQVLDTEAPRHGSPEAVEKVAPWVWPRRGVVMVWYVRAGRALPEAGDLRRHMGGWDGEWSPRHMTQVLRRAVLGATIDPNAGDQEQLRQMVQALKNRADLAA